MQPVIGNNAYAPGPADAPNRLFVRGSLTPTAGWLLLGTLDWRSGLPWSVVNEDLEFVGPRNDQRFPTYLRLNAGFEHRVRIARMQPWLGLRVSNALELVPAVRRLFEHRVACIWHVRQLRVPGVPHPPAVRAIRRSRRLFFRL